MRKDMAKVLVERSRLGGKNQRKGRAKDHEDLPKREGMRKWTARGDRKSLNENLNPLKRFLYSRVGKPWDKVYSELSEHVNKNSAVQAHIFQHLWGFVHKYVDLVDNRAFIKSAHYYRYRRELFKGELFVHPKTGLLKVYKFNKYSSRWKHNKDQEAQNLLRTLVNPKTALLC